MQKFKYINQSEQVYSNDLNQILVNTPPVLYKYLLLSICAIIFCSGLILTLCRFSPSQNINCKVALQNDYQANHDSIVVTLLSTDQSLFKDAAFISLQLTGSKASKDRPLEVPLRKTRINSTAVYYHGHELHEQVDEINLKDLDEVRPYYRYQLKIGVASPHTYSSIPKKVSVGTLTLRKKDQRLYERFI